MSDETQPVAAADAPATTDQAATPVAAPTTAEQPVAEATPAKEFAPVVAEASAVRTDFYQLVADVETLANDVAEAIEETAASVVDKVEHLLD